jgi:heptosyltransferase-1
MPAPIPTSPAPADVLVLKPSSFGDIIHTLPAVHFLKAALSASRFHWVVNPEWAPLLQGNPDLASVIVFPRRELRGLAAVPGFFRWCAKARAATGRGGFDLAVDFQGLLRSALMAKGCRAARVLGLSDAREGAGFFYHESADTRGILHAVDRYLALARLAGADTSGPAVFPLPDGEPISGLDPALLSRAVVLHPFARGEGKSLPIEVIDTIIRELAPLPVILAGVGGPADPVWPAGVVSLLGKTSLAQLIWLLRHAGAVVSVDSGPMHLAAALGRPLLGLHTWSDPRVVGPWNPDAHVWKSGLLTRVDALASADPAWAAGPGNWEQSLPDQIAAWVETVGTSFSAQGAFGGGLALRI